MTTRVLAAAALPGLLLAVCCAASAAEPAPVTEVVYGGIKVGIDSATGKLRPLSEQESAALDRVLTRNQQTADERSGPRRLVMPSSIQAAKQTQRAIRGGGNAMKMPMSEMSHVVAVRDASGKLTVQHSDDGTAVPNAVPATAVEEIK